MKIFSGQQLRDVLQYRTLIPFLKTAVLDYAKGAIKVPSRQIEPIPQQKGGVLLSMPCVAADISVHKLLTILPENPAAGRPTIQGAVTVWDNRSGEALYLLDGPTVTSMRTAGMSMLGVDVFCDKAPLHIVIVGTGVQATAHAQAIQELYPEARLTVAARDIEAATQFVQHLQNGRMTMQPTLVQDLPCDADVYITLTSATEPFYKLPAQAGRLVIAVGAFQPHMSEIYPAIINASQCYIDDIKGGEHEAGDYLRARKPWDTIHPLATALLEGVDLARPIVFKTVGAAVWDLALGRAVHDFLSTQATG